MVCITSPDTGEIPTDCEGVIIVGQDAEMAAGRARDLEDGGLRSAVLIGDLADASVRAAARMFAAEIFPGKEIRDL